MTQNQNARSYVDWLISLNYSEKPATMDELICDPKFFGNLTRGGKTVFPIWRKHLREISEEDAKFLVVFTGAIGTGKTYAGMLGVAHTMMKILCLKDPWYYYGKAEGGRMTIEFFNLTKDLGKSNAFIKLQNYLCSSPWFVAKAESMGGGIVGTGKNRQLDIPLFEYRLASIGMKGKGIVGADVIIAIMDEVDSEGATESVQMKVLEAYNATYLRFYSRFVHRGYVNSIGKFFLIASKQDELSFLNTFIIEHKDEPNLVVVDVPLWEVGDQTYSGRKFSISIGDIYTPSKILHSMGDKIEAQQADRKILEIPIEFYNAFKRNIDSACRDIGGISVSKTRTSKLFASPKIIKDCYDRTKEDPVSKTTIECGLRTDINLIDFIDFDAIRMPRSVKRFIHLDMAYAAGGDCLGIAMSGIQCWDLHKIRQANGGYKEKKVPIVETDFAFRLKAPEGDQIHFAKIRDFILALAGKGYDIKVTADYNAMSVDMLQTLTLEHIECEDFSLDKTPAGYIAFRNVVNAKNWVCHLNDLLDFELVNLEHDKEKNKIDHPRKIADIRFLADGSSKEIVMLGSKDVADAVAGTVFKALEYADALPVDEKLMVSIMQQATTIITEPDVKPHWWLSQDTAFAPGAEKYVLQDPNGDFWLWVRETRSEQPRVLGPYLAKPMKMDAIAVEDPDKFLPTTVEVKKDDDKIGRFLDILDHVRKNQE